MKLRERITQEIRASGPIPFSRYMEICLYDPEQGYYSRNLEQFGKAGDFYTSSDVHAVFGRLLARQFEEMWRVLGSPEQIELLELGPGRGLFARDVLDWSEKRVPEFFGALHYSLNERSAALRER
ncbi:MAG: SAM-dependent methyltransferase, partial [Terriglobales bacterium]